MKGGLRAAALLWAAWGATGLALAQDSERSRFYIQQMIDRAAAHDETGVIAMQRMLEQEPRPNPPNKTAADESLHRGQNALRTGDLNAALAAFQQASQAHPGSAEIFNLLGLVERKLGRLADAERALQRALGLEPARAVAWFQLAQIYGLKGDRGRTRGALANTYRFAQNPMRAEEILRNIAEKEASDTLRNAALETLRLYRLPAEAVVVPPLPANPGIEPLKPASNPGRAP